MTTVSKMGKIETVTQSEYSLSRVQELSLAAATLFVAGTLISGLTAAGEHMIFNHFNPHPAHEQIVVVSSEN